MEHVIVDNLSLIDKMHEGLIVLSEQDMSLVFASIPAVHLLQQRPKLQHEAETPRDTKIKNQMHLACSFPLKQSDLLKPMFQPTKVSLNANESKTSKDNRKPV